MVATPIALFSGDGVGERGACASMCGGAAISQQARSARYFSFRRNRTEQWVLNIVRRWAARNAQQDFGLNRFAATLINKPANLRCGIFFSRTRLVLIDARRVDPLAAGPFDTTKSVEECMLLLGGFARMSRAYATAQAETCWRPRSDMIQATRCLCN
jgi:hypothetical protein